MPRKRGRKNLPVSIVKSAPGELRLVQELVNTADLRKGTEELTSPLSLKGWLAERGLLGAEAEVTARDLEQAIEIREGLRALAAANNGADLDEPSVARLNAALGAARLRVLFRVNGPGILVPESRSFDGALARLAGIVVTAQLAGDWSRLKACAHEACRGVFYDGSQNRSGKWCSMRRCGSQLNSLAYRRRRPLPSIRRPFSDG